MILFILNKNIEQFQYIKKNNNFEAIEFIKIPKKNVILTIPITNYTECSDLCLTTPKCNSFNEALGQCTLYKNIVYKPTKKYYRYW